jgi:RES domain-containing protein
VCATGWHWFGLCKKPYIRLIARPPSPAARRRQSTIVRITGSLYRADHPAHTDLARTTAESREHPGRFNTSRFGAVYLSLEPETAIRELRRNGGDHPQCALFVVDAALERVLDLTDRDTMAEWNVTTADLQDDDVSRCQQIAEEAADLGIEAVMWPSATGDGRSLAVFAGRLSQGSRLEILQKYELSQPAIRSIEAGVAVSALLPLLPQRAKR